MTENQEHYNRLLRETAAWRFVRWPQVFCALVVVAVGVLFSYQGFKRAASAEEWDLKAVAYLPLGIFLFMEGVRLLINTLIRWGGDPVVRLLLYSLRKDEVLGAEKPAGEPPKT